MTDQTLPSLKPAVPASSVPTPLEHMGTAAPLPPHPSTIGAYNPVLEGDKGDAQIQQTLDSAVHDLVENTRVDTSSSSTVAQQPTPLSDEPPTLPPPTLPVAQPMHAAVTSPPTTQIEQLTSDVTAEVKEVIREDVSLVSKEPMVSTAGSSKRWRVALYIAGGLGIFLLGMVASVAVLTLL